MRFHYSYEIWVPRERLYDAAVAIAQREQFCEFGLLIWPDGRPLSELSDVQKSERLRFGAEYGLMFAFASDDELGEFDSSEWGFGRHYEEPTPPISQAVEPLNWPGFLRRLLGRAPAPEIETSPQIQAILLDENSDFGKRRKSVAQVLVGPIEIYFNEFPEGHEWIDGEEDLVRIHFVAANSAVSNVFNVHFSNSARQFFVDLAREIGAYCCVFDQEGPGRLLYLGGEDFDVPFDEYSIASPFELATLAGRPQSENARLMSELAHISWRADLESQSGSQLLDAARHENSGVRAQALKKLGEMEDEIAHNAIKTALADPDARVRELAVYFYARAESKDFAPLLPIMHSDSSDEVRLRAIRALGEFDNSLEVLREIVLSSYAPLDEFTLEAALQALDSLLYLPRSAEILHEILSRADFPLRHRLQGQLKEWHAIQMRLAENEKRR